MQGPQDNSLAVQMAAIKATNERDSVYIRETLARIEQKLDTHIESQDKKTDDLTDRMTRAEKDISTGRYLIGVASTLATGALGAWLKTALGI